MVSENKKTYAAPGARFSWLQLESFCESGGQQEGNNGQIDDLVDFEDVWF